jgi:hypothetical protein
MSENMQQFTIEEKDGYLLITFPPYKSLGQAESCITAMYDAVDKYDCRKLLIDLRATVKKVPIMELYELCIYLVSKFGTVHPKIAVIASPEAVYPDRFGENVVRNRGLDLIRFVSDMQEAVDWLLAKPSSKTKGFQK